MLDTPENLSNECKNQVLAEVLAELGWSQGRLVSAVTEYLGPGYIGRSTVSEWVRQGRVPRDPLPTVVAHVLSDAAGRKIGVTDLWQHAGKASSPWTSADHGLDMSWDYQSVLGVADDWITNAGRTMDYDRRRFMALSGATLTLPAWSFVENMPHEPSTEFLSSVGARDSMKVTPSIVNILESTTKELEILEEREGGNDNTLRFAHSTFNKVADYVKSGNFSDKHTQQRLLTVWAQLCRIAGFIALDAGKHGLAQRYYFTGLQVTSTNGDSELGAHILSNLSYQATQRGRGNAVQLAEAAMAAADQCPSLAIQAFTASRYALAQASMGNDYACRTAMDKARNLLESPDMPTTRPRYLSWFDTTMLDTHSGHSLLVLAQSTSRDARYLIDAAQNLLSPHMVGTSDFRGEFSRDVLFWGSWLARGYVRCGELEQAVHTGATLLDIIPSVHSQRTTTLLRHLNSELSRYRGALKNPRIAKFSKNLNRSLETAAV